MSGEENELIGGQEAEGQARDVLFAILDLLEGLPPEYRLRVIRAVLAYYQCGEG